MTYYEAPDSDLTEVADQISIGDLLAVEETQDLAIRFLSSIRKALLDTPPDRIDKSAALAARVYRCNDLISRERRDAAFEGGRKFPPPEPPCERFERFDQPSRRF